MSQLDSFQKVILAEMGIHCWQSRDDDEFLSQQQSEQNSAISEPQQSSAADNRFSSNVSQKPSTPSQSGQERLSQLSALLSSKNDKEAKNSGTDTSGVGSSAKVQPAPQVSKPTQVEVDKVDNKVDKGQSLVSSAISNNEVDKGQSLVSPAISNNEVDKGQSLVPPAISNNNTTAQRLRSEILLCLPEGQVKQDLIQILKQLSLPYVLLTPEEQTVDRYRFAIGWQPLSSALTEKQLSMANATPQEKKRLWQYFVKRAQKRSGNA